MKNLIITLFTALCFSSCDFIGTSSFCIDNPTEKEISVTLDGKLYQLPPDHSEKVSLQVGMHNITLPDGNAVKFNVYDKSKGAIINPTRSLYITYTMIYAVDDKASKGFVTQDKELCIDGVPYEGPISTISDLLIDKNLTNYTYGLREPFPKQITRGGDSKGDFQSKIFTQKEFIDFCEEENESKGYHEKNKVDGAVNIPSKSYAKIEYPTANFTIPELKTAAEKIIGMLKQYIASTNAEEQKKIMKEYHEEYYGLYEKAKPMSEYENIKKYTTQERKDFENFTWMCDRIIMRGVAEMNYQQ